MYAIMRTKKIKSYSEISNIEGHNSRKYKVENADPKRTIDNIKLVDSLNFVDDVKKRIGDRKVRKNAVYAIELLLTASPEFFRKNKDDYGVYEKNKVDAFNSSALSFLKKEFGDLNIVSVICHLDEATPHIQAVIVPIDPNTDKLSPKYWFDGRKKMQEFQDRYWGFMRHLGLERGIKGSEAEHTTIREYYGTIQNSEVPKIDVLVSKPPIINPHPQQWADQEGEKIEESIRKIFDKIQKVANFSAINRKQANESRKTAKKYFKKNEILEKELNYLKSKLESERLESEKKINNLKLEVLKNIKPMQNEFLKIQSENKELIEKNRNLSELIEKIVNVDGIMELDEVIEIFEQYNQKPETESRMRM